MSMPYQEPGQQSNNTGQQPIVIQMPPSQQPQQEPGFTPEQIAAIEQRINAERERVRKEEKDKLYPEMQQFQAELQQLRTEREQRLAAEQEAQQQAAEAERRRQEEEMTVAQRFEAFQQQQMAENERLRQEVEAERALRRKEAEYAALQDYTNRRLREESDNIAPEFVDLISGNTPEEIEASIANMKQRTERILENLAAAQGQQQMMYPPQRPPAVPVSGAPPVDMQGQHEEQVQRFTPEQLAAMPIEEYRRLRPQLLNAVSQRVRESGPYAP